MHATKAHARPCDDGAGTEGVNRSGSSSLAVGLENGNNKCHRMSVCIVFSGVLSLDR